MRLFLAGLLAGAVAAIYVITKPAQTRCGDPTCRNCTGRDD